MLAHPDDFMPFLPSITGEDSAGATDDGLMTEPQFKKYCSLVAETGEWGGEPEVRMDHRHGMKANAKIQALSRAYNVPIHVIQSGPPTIVSHGGSDDAFGGGLTPEQSAAQGDRVVRISYHKRMYGLGEVS
jgi:OTU domain-containing protein 6